MNVAVYIRSIEYLEPEELKALLQLGRQYGISFSFNKEYAVQAGMQLSTYGSEQEIPEDTRCIISYGGDGTFLHTANFLKDRKLPILGINSGRLGFLSSVNKDDKETAIQSLIDGDFRTEERSMIKAEGCFAPEISTLDALNEFTLQKNGLNMISVDVHVSGEYVATYLADGIIVSTPTGSTAYSLSVGGPIVAPDCGCFIINPIAPHNLTMRPLIIGASSSIRLKVTTRNNSCIATMDNRSFKVGNDAEFRLSLSSKKIKILKPGDLSFYDTLRKKLMWAMDHRERHKC